MTCPVEFAKSIWSKHNDVRQWILAFYATVYDKGYCEGYKAAVEQNAPQNTIVARAPYDTL